MTRSAGIIKWFGGFNRKKSVENKFGFIEGLNDNDVYMHLNEWRGANPPEQGLAVTYTLEGGRGVGEWTARNVEALNDTPQLIKLDIEFIRDLNTQCQKSLSASVAAKIRKLLASKLSKGLRNFDKSEQARCIDLFGIKALSILLHQESEWKDNLLLMSESGLVSALHDIEWNLLPDNYFDNQSAQFAEHLSTLDKENATQLVQTAIDKLPDDLVMFSILSGLFEDPGEIERLAKKLNGYIKGLYSGDVILPAYLKEYIDTSVRSRGGIIKDPLIGHIFSYYQFMKYLYEKDLKFTNLYETSEYLQSRLDIFILKELFGLYLSGNFIDKIYNIFLGRLWKHLISNNINLEDYVYQILKLFPTCSTLPNQLSCEAIYWEKQDIFLCRGSRCSTPKVLGGRASNYLDFSIYDWFGHYGIDYISERKPSNRDFPIKLSGYLNRLREIFHVLHCRSCAKLMLPDMKYARNEYIEFINGEFVTRDMAPAYRLTVFKCNNSQCDEFQKGYYINHCLGYACFELIDSRDCKKKCDSGLFICRSCGSCCELHAKNNPAGMCPDCGAGLKLFESENYDKRASRFTRYVECSNRNCDFTSHSLSKRFYLDSCRPVNRVAKSSVTAHSSDIEDWRSEFERAQ